MPARPPISKEAFLSGLSEATCWCEEPFNNEHKPTIIACHHIHGINCIKRWVRSGNSNANLCPTCRAVMFEDTSLDSDEGPESANRESHRDAQHEASQDTAIQNTRDIPPIAVTQRSTTSPPMSPISSLSIGALDLRGGTTTVHSTLSPSEADLLWGHFKSDSHARTFVNDLWHEVEHNLRYSLRREGGRLTNRLLSRIIAKILEILEHPLYSSSQAFSNYVVHLSAAKENVSGTTESHKYADGMCWKLIKMVWEMIQIDRIVLYYARVDPWIFVHMMDALAFERNVDWNLFNDAVDGGIAPNIEDTVLQFLAQVSAAMGLGAFTQNNTVCSLTREGLEAWHGQPSPTLIDRTSRARCHFNDHSSFSDHNNRVAVNRVLPALVQILREGSTR